MKWSIQARRWEKTDFKSIADNENRINFLNSERLPTKTWASSGASRPTELGQRGHSLESVRFQETGSFIACHCNSGEPHCNEWDSMPEGWRLQLLRTVQWSLFWIALQNGDSSDKNSTVTLEIGELAGQRGVRSCLSRKNPAGPSLLHRPHHKSDTGVMMLMAAFHVTADGIQISRLLSPYTTTLCLWNKWNMRKPVCYLSALPQRKIRS